jgi:putative transposase
LIRESVVRRQTMRKSRFSEEHVIGVLREQGTGTNAAEVCRRQRISEQTFYQWKAKYGRMGSSDAQRLKSFVDETSSSEEAAGGVAARHRHAEGSKDLLAEAELACSVAYGYAAPVGGARLLSASRLQANRNGP